MVRLDFEYSDFKISLIGTVPKINDFIAESDLFMDYGEEAKNKKISSHKKLHSELKGIISFNGREGSCSGSVDEVISFIFNFIERSRAEEVKKVIKIAQSWGDSNLNAQIRDLRSRINKDVEQSLWTTQYDSPPYYYDVAVDYCDLGNAKWSKSIAGHPVRQTTSGYVDIGGEKSTYLRAEALSPEPDHEAQRAKSSGAAQAKKDFQKRILNALNAIAMGETSQTKAVETKNVNVRVENLDACLGQSNDRR